MLRHLVLALVVLSGLLTGCSTYVAGREVGADEFTASRVADDQLDDLPASAQDVEDIVGLPVRVDQRIDKPGTATYLKERDCLAAWAPLDQETYGSTDWSELSGQILLDRRNPADPQVVVVQGVVAFPSLGAADAFFRTSAEEWAQCANRQLTYAKPGAVARWQLGDLTRTDDTLTMTQTRQRGNGWQCQRAMAVHANVAIDALMCGYRVDDQAAEIVGAIAARLPRP